MMRSLSSAVAGLRTHQTKMDVIGNNIANVNTFGFKASRTTFSDVYYQNLSSGAGPSTATGGTNPTQIGYGSSVATIDVLNTQAGSASTDRPMDVYITADGFLVTQDSTGRFFFTRLGNLGFDEAGNLCDSQGNYVMGFPLKEDGTPNINPDGTIEGDAMLPIQVDPALLDELTGIQITAGGQIVGILAGDQTIKLGTSVPDWITPDSASIPEDSNIGGPIRLKVRAEFGVDDLTAALADAGLTGITAESISFSDSLCMEKDLKVTVSKSGEILVSGYYMNENGKRTEMVAKARVSVADDGTITAPETLSFKHNNKEVFALEGVTATAAEIEDPLPADPVEIEGTYKYQGTWKDNGDNTNYEPLDDGKPGWTELTGSGIFSFGDVAIGFDVGADGANAGAFNGIVANVTTTDGSRLDIGCIALANFRNAAALEEVGNSKFVESANSGEAKFGKPGTNGLGSLKSNYLEMSNVDIAKEFTEMITTQRGFQANTRIVTVSDEMLQELVNLKR